MSCTTNCTSSPCVGICKLDKNKVCIGCFRTLNEIIETGKKYAKKEKKDHTQEVRPCSKG